MTAALLVALTVVGTFVGAALLANNLQTFRFPPLRMGEFALGVVAAVAMRRGWRPPIGLPTATFGVVVAYAVGAVLWSHGGHAWLVNVLAGPAFALVVVAGASRDAGGATTSRWLTRLGRWSFAFYLLHWPVLEVMAQADMNAAVATLVAFSVTLALSAALYAGFERPVERWLRSVPWSRPLTPAAAAIRPRPTA